MSGIGHNIEGAGIESLQRIANDINSELDGSIEGFFSVGRKFIENKKALGHGSYLRLFANHKDPLHEPVRMTPRYAQKIMSIASNDIITNTSHATYLPRDATILYELSRIDEAGLKIAFAEGWITPYLKRKDIKDIRIRVGLDDEKAIKTPSNSMSEELYKIRKKAKNYICLLSLEEANEYALTIEALAEELINDVEKRNHAVKAAE